MLTRLTLCSQTKGAAGNTRKNNIEQLAWLKTRLRWRCVHKPSQAAMCSQTRGAAASGLLMFNRRLSGIAGKFGCFCFLCFTCVSCFKAVILALTISMGNVPCSSLSQWWCQRGATEVVPHELWCLSENHQTQAWYRFYKGWSYMKHIHPQCHSDNHQIYGVPNESIICLIQRTFTRHIFISFEPQHYSWEF